MNESRKALSEHKLDAERTRGKLEYQARQIAGIEQRLRQGETESVELEKRLERVGADLDTHARSLAEAEEQTEVARQRMTAKNQQREQLQASLSDRERAMETSRQQVLRLLGETSTLKNQLAQIDTYVASIDRDTARIQRDEQTASADLESLTGRKTELSEKIASRQLALRSTGDQRRLAEEELATQKSRAAETRRLLDQLRGELSRVKARKDSLEEVISHRSYTTESVKRLFKAIEKGQAQDLKPAGVLADFVEVVDAAYEKATEEFLHEELEYVVVRNWEEAAQGIEVMRSSLDGRATFLVHPEAGHESRSAPVREPAISPETGVVARLSDLLKLTNGFSHAPADLLPRVARCYLVEDRQSAQRLAVEYPDIYFLLPDGVCFYGHTVSGRQEDGCGSAGAQA